MANAIAFMIIVAACLAAAVWIGIKIGAVRERVRQRAIDANNHAMRLRAESLKPKPASELDLLSAVFRRLPVSADYTEESAFGGPLVRVRPKNLRAYTIFEFDQGGSLRNVEPCT